MRITAFVKSLDNVCCRYRLAVYRPFLEAAGHRLDLQPWPRDWWSRLWLRRHVGRADAIILQRRLPSPRQLAILQQSASFLLYDFDDAIFIRDSFAQRGTHCSSRAEGFANVVRAAHAVVAGNPFLQEHAALWAPPERIQLIPTFVNPDSYPRAAHARRHGAQLAWIGSSSTLPALAFIRPLLEALGRRRQGLELKIICDRFLSMEHVPVVRVLWTQEREALELAGADIGISWLPDDLWSQGKCGLKVLQYMAAGLPVVANPVGMQATLIRDGETGFLVRTAPEWQEAIDRLARDPALRTRMGKAGRTLVETHYDVSLGARRWLDLLDGLERSPLTATPLPRRCIDENGTETLAGQRGRGEGARQTVQT
jgi:glycosyltransferase involved in cell wall biosynthesis